MNVVTVGIGGLAASADPGDVLVTYGLGSCIAVMAYGKDRRAAGMLHFQLPSASLAPERARLAPGAFADTGVPLLLQRMRQLGCSERDLVVKVAGGGTFHGDGDVFAIGKRNYTVLRSVLWKARLLIAAEDVGGSVSRTARFHVDTGQVTIHRGGEVRPL